MSQVWDNSGLDQRQQAMHTNGASLDWVQRQRVSEAERYAQHSESSDDEAEDDDVRNPDRAQHSHSCCL